MNKIKELFNSIWRSELRWPVMGLTLIAFTGGYLIRGTSSMDQRPEHETLSATVKNAEIWTCSMHPQIRRPDPGQCPICGMDLIPVSLEETRESAPRELKLSPAAEKLAEIQVTAVERKYVVAEIRMVGKVEYDETRLGYISAYVPGRIDHLYVNYTGTIVHKGDHLVSLYSPELISAQEELLQSLNTLEEMNTGKNPELHATALRTVEAVREKLRLWGLTEAQIKAIEDQGKHDDRLTIYSPMSGVVIHRNATEGMYINTGTPIYTIADLSKVWVKLDAYESDLGWIRYGQEVEFETQAYPGETFLGQIAFIDPVLNPQTRTVKVRVNVDNREGKLKPEMFVRAVVRSRLSVSGRVMDPELTGKWISPMHPEIIKDHPGKCDICGMPLVKAEQLGYISASAAEKEAPLVIPKSAPLITGKRAVVYVAMEGAAGTYRGREVVLGPRAGDYYLVRQGLSAGELVVVNGGFKLDSDLQIRVQPSMMNPGGGAAPPGHQHHPAAAGESSPKAVEEADIAGQFSASLQPVFSTYFDIQHALSHDNLPLAKENGGNLRTAVDQTDMTLLRDQRHLTWMDLLKKLQNSTGAFIAAEDIARARKEFQQLSGSVYETLKRFGTAPGKTVYRYFCPMASDNQGAYWLQNRQPLENPYFGAEMFKCGELVETIEGRQATRDHQDHDHP